MKLHLPKLLTAALIAAFVSFTQASGTTLDNAVLTLKDFTQDSIDAANQAGWTLTNVTAAESGIFTSTATQAYITHDTAWTTTTGASSRTPWSAILTINLNSLGTSGTGVLIESANSPQQAANARMEGLAYDAAGNQKLEAAWQGTTWTNLIVTDNLKSFADDNGNVTVGLVYEGENGTHIYVGGSAGYNKGLKGSNNCGGNPTIFLGDHQGIEYSNLYLFSGAVSDDDMKAMLASMRVSVTWTGSVDNKWDTTTQNWVKTGTQDPATFVKKADVTFGADVQAKVVNVAEDATATAMSVSGDYTFNVAEGKALVADGLTLPTGAQTLTFGMADGASFKLVGGLTLAGKTLNLTGTGKATLPNLTLNGGTLNVSSNLDITDTGNATVVTSQDGQASTISVQGGTTTVTGGIHFKGGNGSTIKIGTEGTAAKLVTGRLEVGDNTGGTSYLTIGANGTLIITSTNDVHGADGNYKQTGLLLGEWGQKTQTSVAGKLYAKDVNLRQGNQPLDITIQSGGVVAVKGINRGANHNEASAVTMNENSKLILGADGFINDGGNWTITLNGGEIGMTEATTTLARAMNVAGDVTFNTAKYTWSGSADTLVLNPGVDGGTMTVSGNLTGTGSITKTGAGELILSGTANVLGDTITLNGGTLSLTGAFNLDALTVQGSGTEYVGDGGVTIPTGSGFAKTSGTITVVDKKAGTLSIGQDATFTYGSGTVEVNAETGVATLSGEVDYSTLWVNGTDEVSYSAAQTLAGAITVGTVHLNHEGATVAMDMAATIALVIKEGASTTVNATADTTISSLTGPTSGKTLTIGGSSVVTINGDNTAFASNVTIVGGTVKISDQKSLGEHNNGVSQAKTITIAEGGTLDLNGIGDANYTYTMAGGKLTNTGNALSTNLSQTVGMTLTANSSVEALADKQFWLRARGSNATTLDLDGNTLVKTGAGMFGVYKSTVSTGTIEVRGGVFKFESGGTTAADVILNGGTIAGALNMAGNITVTAKESTTTDATFSIGTDKTLKLATDEGEKLTLSNGLSVAAGTAEIAGTVNVNSKSLDLSSGGNSTGKVKVDDGGTLNVSSSMWMGKNSSGVELAEGGILNLANLNIVGKTGGGSVTTTADNELYNTEKAAFAINKATVTATGDVIIGNTLSGVDVVTGEHEVTLNSNADSVTVSGNGKFTLGDSVVVANGITVEDGGTIVDGVDAQDVTIEAKGTATFEQGVDDNQNYVSYFGNQDADVQVTNNSEEAAPYRGIGDANMTVRAATLFAASGEHVTVENQVIVNSIYNVGDAVTISHVDTKVLDSISNEGGQVTLMNVETDPVELSNLLTTEKTVAVYQGADESTEGTIVISDTLYGGSGTLLANLEMLDNSTLDLAVAITEGTTSVALTLGSEFTMQEGVVVNLDSTTLADIAALADNEKKTLIVGLQDTTLTTNLQNGDWASTHFNLSGINGGDYKVFVENNSIGIMKASNVPEPTTGTLSLLALMVLAARRRRK